MKTKYYRAENFEIQIIGEGGCVVGVFCEYYTDFSAALKAYKSRRLLKDEFPKAFNQHHYAKGGEKLGRPVETAGVEKALVVLFEDEEGNDCEMQLMCEFI